MIHKIDYFGFIYLWRDRLTGMFYLGSHMGSETDHYKGSGPSFKKAYRERPEDFKRRILQYCSVDNGRFLLSQEQRWLDQIRYEELGVRYYNKSHIARGIDSKTALIHFVDGTHIFLNSEFHRKNALKRVADGTHNLLGGEAVRQRVVDGTHNLQCSENAKKRVADRTHNFLDKKAAKERAFKQVAKGTHPFLDKNQPKLECPHCGFICRKNMAIRWHFDNCKHRQFLDESA